jgi:benzoate 4-monooxygenase
MNSFPFRPCLMLCRDFYDAFLTARTSIATTRSRAEHSRKRKAVSHTFSTKSVGEFEQYMHVNLELFVKQWTKTCDLQANPSTGYTSVDVFAWMNYLSFDIIGELAFGSSFGMLAKGKDLAEVRKTPDSPLTYVRIAEVLSRRSEVMATIGCYPVIRPYTKYIPDRFFDEGMEAVKKLFRIAAAQVDERLRPDVKATNTRVDILARFMEGRDETGAPLSREELASETMTLMIAGSETIGITISAAVYWILRVPGILEKLQKALDEAIPAGVAVPSFAMVKDVA